MPRKKKAKTLAQAIKSPIYTGSAVIKVFDIPKESKAVGLHLTFNSERDRALFIRTLESEDEE